MFSAIEAVLRPLASVGVKRKSFSASSKKGDSLIRVNFCKEVEDAIQRQITEELNAAYSYFSMASVFGRDTVALPGFQRLFNKFADEELGHARHWVDYLNLRGGKVKFYSVKEVEDVDWTPLCAASKAIDMEITMTKDILRLRSLAEKHGDFHSAKFIEDDFLFDQYDGLKKLGDLKTQIERVADNVGLYLMDCKVWEDFERKNG